jgi:ATP-dependent RNA helicase RhlE
MDSFASFHLIAPLEKALQEQGHIKPTPVQAQAIPHILQGNDVIGIAQTGTGKTAAFALPILQYLATHKKTVAKGTPRVLVLVPTRELAMQIAETVRNYAKHLAITELVLYGGVSQEPQIQALSKSVDILIATPGRLFDLIQQKYVRLDAVEVLVLDEADRMLDLGFQQDIKYLMKKLSHARQSLLFSATMSNGIEALAKSYLRNPVNVTVTAQATTANKIKQSVLYVDREDKSLLLRNLLETDNFKRVLVFTQMKHMADKLAVKLRLAGISSDVLHSDKSQAARIETLEQFRAGKTRVLIATDVAARGIDVEGITHVINYDLPVQIETYVHRIGRTARAGAEGTALTFCCSADRDKLKEIELLIGKKLSIREHKYHSSLAQTGAATMANVVKTPPKPSGRKGRTPLSKLSKNWKKR